MVVVDGTIREHTTRIDVAVDDRRAPAGIPIHIVADTVVDDTIRDNVACIAVASTVRRAPVGNLNITALLTFTPNHTISHYSKRNHLIWMQVRRVPPAGIRIKIIAYITSSISFNIKYTVSNCVGSRRVTKYFRP